MQQRVETGGPISVRRATIDDIEQMYLISNAAHAIGYDHYIPKRAFVRFVERYTAERGTWRAFYRLMRIRIPHRSWMYYVAESDGVVVGYHYARRQSSTNARLRGLFVHPDYQGLGLGSKLFGTMDAALHDSVIELTVLKRNAGAIGLYERYGYVHNGRSARRYFGAEQIEMVRQPKRERIDK